MQVKIGRYNYIVDSSDYILDNGAVFQLMTKKVPSGSNKGRSPIVSKTTLNAMLKQGILVKTNKKFIGYFGETDYTVYQFVGVSL